MLSRRDQIIDHKLTMMVLQAGESVQFIKIGNILLLCRFFSSFRFGSPRQQALC